MITDNYLELIYEISLNGVPGKGFDPVLAGMAEAGLANGTLGIVMNGTLVGPDGEELEIDRFRKAMIYRAAARGAPLVTSLEEVGETGFLLCVPAAEDGGTMAVLAAERTTDDRQVLEKDLQFLTIMSSFCVLPILGERDSGKIPPGISGGLSLTEQVENFERKLIIEALRETRGNQSRAAEKLGVSLRIINYRINKLGLDYRRFRKKG